MGFLGGEHCDCIISCFESCGVPEGVKLVFKLGFTFSRFDYLDTADYLIRTEMATGR